MSGLPQKYQKLRQELAIGIILLGLVFFIGTAWYCIVEGWSWIDSAYMTTITLSTVGFGETRPLSPLSRLFTIILIFMGLLNIAYLVNRFTDALIQGYFQEAVKISQEKRLLDSLSGHYIICGFGRMGKQVALEFQAEGILFVVIDSNPEQVENAKAIDYITLQGNATLDETLLKAKIDKAICLVASLPSDADNLYTIISARALNPQIRAIARANTEDALQKLQRAGADAVISPYITGGKRLAAAALRPQVMDFVDGIISGTERSLYLEEFRLDSNTCPFEGVSLRDAQLRMQSGALVLAIRRADGTLIGGPTGETVLMAHDVLMCMGTEEQLRRLNNLLSPLSSPRAPKNHS